MSGPTLPFAPKETYHLISVDLREKKKKSFFYSLSLSSHSLCLPSPFLFIPFDFLFFVFIFFWIHGSHYAMCPSFIRVRFFPETIYFFLVQFILNELSSSHFLTSEICIKISSLESLATDHPENRKNIPIVSKFDETFLGH